MNNKDYLLISLGEEAGEVQQAVGKALRFGLSDSNPKLGNTSDRGLTNWASLRQEVHDLLAVYEMLCNDLGLGADLNRGLIEDNKTKVLKWMDYAESKGRLDR